MRTCDGFYFPIGDSVGRERLHSDARACSARCDGEAKLFYYPTNGGSVETMVDMAGRPYAQLPTAFLYRKTLVQGCTCKPAPGRRKPPRATRATRTRRRRWRKCAAAGERALRRPGDVPPGGWQGDGDGEIEAYLQRESDGPRRPLGRRRPPLLSLLRPPHISVIPL